MCLGLRPRGVCRAAARPIVRWLQLSLLCLAPCLPPRLDSFLPRSTATPSTSSPSCAPRAASSGRAWWRRRPPSSGRRVSAWEGGSSGGGGEEPRWLQRALAVSPRWPAAAPADLTDPHPFPLLPSPPPPLPTQARTRWTSATRSRGTRWPKRWRTSSGPSPSPRRRPRTLLRLLRRRSPRRRRPRWVCGWLRVGCARAVAGGVCCARWEAAPAPRPRPSQARAVCVPLHSIPSQSQGLPPMERKKKGGA